METRPFYKKVAALLGELTVHRLGPKKEVSEFPLSPPDKEDKPTRAGTTKATRGAFGKCRYCFDPSISSDPRFNHSLRRKNR